MRKENTKVLNLKLDRLIGLLAAVKRLELPYEVDHILATPAICDPELELFIKTQLLNTLDPSVQVGQVDVLFNALYELVMLSNECILYMDRIITHSSQRLTKAGYPIRAVYDRHADKYIGLYYQLPFGRVYFHLDPTHIEPLVDAVNWGIDENEEIDVSTEADEGIEPPPMPEETPVATPDIQSLDLPTTLPVATPVIEDLHWIDRYLAKIGLQRLSREV